MITGDTGSMTEMRSLAVPRPTFPEFMERSDVDFAQFKSMDHIVEWLVDHSG